jgi:predicted enzyme related to lactoylglutathione lyase
MERPSPRFLGTELYFDELETARRFYEEALSLKLAEAKPRQYVKFNAGQAFVCLERKGSESYPSLDKAALFFEVQDIRDAVSSIGEERLVGGDPRSLRPWAVVHDPEGHNVLLLQAVGLSA